MPTNRQNATVERQKIAGKKFRRVGGEIKDAIEKRVVEDDWRAPDIHEDLKERFRKRAPTLRTVERWVKVFAPPDPSGAWRFADADPQDAALVLPVLPDLRVPGVRPLTEEEASWIVRLRRAVPQMPPVVVRAMARQYMSYEHRNLSTEPLDQILAQLCRPSADAEEQTKAAGSHPAPKRGAKS